MEKLNYLLEGLPKEQGIEHIFSLLFCGFLNIVGKRTRCKNNPEFLGDNLPYTLIKHLEQK